MQTHSFVEPYEYKGFQLLALLGPDDQITVYEKKQSRGVLLPVEEINLESWSLSKPTSGAFRDAGEQRRNIMSKIQDNQQAAIEGEKLKISYYAFIRDYHSDKCVVLAKGDEEAEQKATTKGVSPWTAECKAFTTKLTAQRWLKIKSLKLELAYVQNQLNRSHRAPQSTIDSLEEEQERLQGLMDEIDFVDWDEETWDDEDWNQSDVDNWLFFYEDV